MNPPAAPRAHRLALTLILALATLAACSRDPESARWSRGEAVGRLVAELLQQKEPPDSINLADIAPFRWDRLYIFAPHTSAQAVDQALGVTWVGAERSGIAQVDTAALLVFMVGDDIVAATMHPRAYGDFVPSAGGPPRTPARAVFRVERTAGGWVMHGP